MDHESICHAGPDGTAPDPVCAGVGTDSGNARAVGANGIGMIGAGETVTYSLPADPAEDWAGHAAPDFSPNPRQALVMRVVEAALDEGVFYTRDMYAYAVAALAPDAATLARRTRPVEGGDIAMDVHYAQCAVEAKRHRTRLVATARELGLQPGERLGALVFNDFKPMRGARIESVSPQGLTAVITAALGSRKVSIEADAIAVKDAIERAHARGKREDSYAEFMAARRQGTRRLQRQRRQFQGRARREACRPRRSVLQAPAGPSRRAGSRAVPRSAVHSLLPCQSPVQVGAFPSSGLNNCKNITRGTS